MKTIKNALYEIWAPLPGTQDWGAYLLELNVRRIACVAAVVLIFQLGNLIMARFALMELPILGVGLLIALSVVYGLAAFLIPFRIVSHKKLARFFYLSFWILLFAGFIPFFVRDFRLGGSLMNVLLFFGVLIIVPAFTRLERNVLVPLFAAATLVTALLNGASALQLVFLALIGAGGWLLSYAIKERSQTFLRGLMYEAYCDVLTGVLNRRGGLNSIRKKLDAVKDQSDKLAFYMVDIDFFKNVNDAHGHHMGDEVLVVVANTLKLLFDAPGNIICRIGGEEFLVCVPVQSREEAGEYAEKLLRKVEDQHIPTPRKEASHYLTVSVGVRVYTPENPGDSIDELSLIDDADTALYRAKDDGRNRYVIY